jgi:hypothetical protein
MISLERREKMGVAKSRGRVDNREKRRHLSAWGRGREGEALVGEVWGDAMGGHC